MAAKLLSGLGKGVYKGGRTRLKMRFAGRKAVRKVQRYFGLGRYDAEPRLAKITAKTLFYPSTTSRGATITGISPKAKKAAGIAASLAVTQRRRRTGLALGGLGAYAGVGASVYVGRQKKERIRRAKISQARKRKI